MRNDETKRLKQLLTTKLTDAERMEIERQISELDKPVHRQRPRLSKWVLGTWDREPSRPTNVAGSSSPDSPPATGPNTEGERLKPNEEHPSPVEDSSPENDAPNPGLSVAELVEKLNGIKDQLSLLSTVRASNPFSLELAQQFEGLRSVFQNYALELEAKDFTAYLEIVAGQDWLLSPIQKIEKPTLPDRAQLWMDLTWHVALEPETKKAPRPPDSLPDGLDWILR